MVRAMFLALMIRILLGLVGFSWGVVAWWIIWQGAYPYGTAICVLS